MKVKKTMLIELAVADAYAAAYEFTSPDYIEQNHDMSTYRVHPRYGENGEVRTEAGQYTDDTQMSIAIAELVLQDGIWNQFHTLNRILKVFKRDPRKGYSKRMQNILEHCENADQLMRVICPMAQSNGSVIRSVPLAFLSKDKIEAAAYAQASATHASRNGVMCSAYTAFIGYELLHGGDIDDAVRFACGELNYPKMIPGVNQPVPCSAILTLRAAYRLLKNHNNLYDILDNAVKLGGDTDSVAAVAVGLASLSPRYDSNLPQELYDGLEQWNGNIEDIDFDLTDTSSNKYGMDFLKELDKKLYETT
jgi:ADP-ribosylglycohydrolase